MSIRHGACCPVGAQVGTNFTLLDQAIAGHPVAPGFSFEYLGLKGDLEFKRDALGHQETRRYYACAEFACSNCDATSYPECPDMCYDNFRRDAPHVKTRMTTARFIALLKDIHPKTPLVNLVGFLLELDCNDILHTLGLGVLEDLAGSILVLLGSCRFWHSDAGLEGQWEVARELLGTYCKARKLPMR